MNAIEITRLQRIFKTHTGVIKRTAKEVRAVEDVSFDIQEGELFGLLGPNGAGKTTTVKMLTTLLIPTSGSATVKGFDVVQTGRRSPQAHRLHLRRRARTVLASLWR